MALKYDEWASDLPFINISKIPVPQSIPIISSIFPSGPLPSPSQPLIKLFYSRKVEFVGRSIFIILLVQFNQTANEPTTWIKWIEFVGPKLYKRPRIKIFFSGVPTCCSVLLWKGGHKLSQSGKKRWKTK